MYVNQINKKSEEKMKKVNLLFIVSILIGNLLSVTIYVDANTGNDLIGNGDSWNPYQTFHKGYLNANHGDTINLNGTFTWQSPYETGDQAHDGYVLDKNITIIGNSLQTTIVQAKPNGAVECLQRVFTIASGASVILKNLEIRNGDIFKEDYHDNYSGGGIYISNNGSLTIDNCYIHDNFAPAFGGGIANMLGNLILKNSTVSENNARLYGSGINISGGTFQAINSTISHNGDDNEMGGPGGGLSIDGCYDASITNCTIAYNIACENGAAEFGGGIFTNNCRIMLKNVIIANNNFVVYSPNLHYIPDDFAIDSLTLLIDNGYNLVEYGGYGSDASILFTKSNDITGNQVNLNVDSMLTYTIGVDSAPTLSLSSGSPAVNAGNSGVNNSAVVTAVSVPTVDQRGLYRNGITDIGAYEFGALTTPPIAPIVQQINVPLNNTSIIAFSDVDATLQFSGNHDASEIDIIKSFTEPNIIGSLPVSTESIADVFWTVNSSAGNVGNYNITFDLSGISGIQSFSTLRMLKRDDDNSIWQDVVSDIGATLVYNEPFITIQGLSGFSDFVPAGGADNPLPVVLSSFTATQFKNHALLTWQTASEVNNSHWNVYRAQGNVFQTAEQVNALPISGAGTSSAETNYEFLDPSELENEQAYFYWLESVNLAGDSEVFEPTEFYSNHFPDNEEPPEAPLKYGLHAAYPNPFNPSTTLQFMLPETDFADVFIFDVKGRMVKHLVHHQLYEKDELYSVVWNGFDKENKPVASGFYLVKLKYGKGFDTRKILLLK
jgi:hypothetical protein